jgi:DNA-binding NtrC family response regulator
VPESLAAPKPDFTEAIMDKNKDRVLVIEDEEEYLQTYKEWLQPEGYQVSWASDAEEALRKIRSVRPSLILLDLRVPPTHSVEGGLALLRQAREEYPDAKVVIVTADGNKTTALEAIRQGATDYLIKPIDPDVLLIVIARTLERKRLEEEVRRLQRQLQVRHTFEGMTGKSVKMQEVFALVEKAAETTANVLLRGESGSGKELVARAIHARGPRRAGPFVALSCAALPEGVLESELFGHERGAYTDAKQRRIGMIESADGGTLFLDEIGDLPLSTQIKLLRVLQEREITRVGGNQPIHVNVRVISATHQDLERLRAEGKFRDDLYYRLSAFTIHLPRLRSRGEDIQLLAEHFLAKYTEVDKKTILGLAPETADLLMTYSWPGNVRELENEIHGAIAKADHGGWIRPEHLSPGLRAVQDLVQLAGDKDGSLNALLNQLERLIIKEKLAKNRGNRTATAKSLGISRVNLHQKLAKYGIE